MLKIVVKGRKDAKAVKHAVNTSVVTVSNLEKLSGFVIFLCGRTDEQLVEIFEDVRKDHPLCVIQKINKSRVRNARLEEIRAAVELAKAKLRLEMSFDDAYIFDPANNMNLEIHPDFDVYFAIGDDFRENLRDIGVDVGENAVVLRKLYNEELYYSPHLKARILKTIGKSLEVETFESCTIDVPLEKLVDANKRWIQEIEKASVEFLRKFCDKEVYVPVSGGKDSTAALILAKKAFGDVKAIFIRTNYDMPYTDEYVEYLERKLDVQIIEERIRFDVKKHGMPSFDNRWCTALKMKVFEKYKHNILIAGDREAESRIRRMRPEVYRNEVFPLKYWSCAHVQLYIISQGLKLHPLYYHGFYRLGCTICPSLSQWEIILLEKLRKKINRFS